MIRLDFLDNHYFIPSKKYNHSGFYNFKPLNKKTLKIDHNKSVI